MPGLSNCRDSMKEAGVPMGLNSRDAMKTADGTYRSGQALDARECAEVRGEMISVAHGT